MEQELLRSPTPRCLSAETIALFVNGLLEGDKLTEVQNHLEGCDYCRKRVARISEDTNRFGRESSVVGRVLSVAAIARWVSSRRGGLSNIPSELISHIRSIRRDIISPIGRGARTDERKKRRYQMHTGILPLALDPESLEHMIQLVGYAAEPEARFLAAEEEPDGREVEIVRLGDRECIRETYIKESENGLKHLYIGVQKQNARELSEEYAKLRVVVELADQDEPLERFIDLRSPAPVASFGEVDREDIIAIQLHLLEDDHARASQA